MFNSTSSGDPIINIAFAEQFDTNQTAIQIKDFMRTDAFKVKSWADGFK